MLFTTKDDLLPKIYGTLVNGRNVNFGVYYENYRYSSTLVTGVLDISMCFGIHVLGFQSITF